MFPTRAAADHERTIRGRRRRPAHPRCGAVGSKCARAPRPHPGGLGVRQQWLSDPGFMAYNAGWDVQAHPGYDRVTGCIEWPESQWDAFVERLALPADRQGYFYVRDCETGAFVGHAHCAVEPDGAAQSGSTSSLRAGAVGSVSWSFACLSSGSGATPRLSRSSTTSKTRVSPRSARTADPGSCPIPRPTPTGDAPPGPGGWRDHRPGRPLDLRR